MLQNCADHDDADDMAWLQIRVIRVKQSARHTWQVPSGMLCPLRRRADSYEGDINCPKTKGLDSRALWRSALQLGLHANLKQPCGLVRGIATQRTNRWRDSSPHALDHKHRRRQKSCPNDVLASTRDRSDQVRHFKCPGGSSREHYGRSVAAITIGTENVN